MTQSTHQIIEQLPHEYVTCALCGADDPVPQFMIDTRNTILSRVWLNGVEQQVWSKETLVRCRQCSLVYVNPRLADVPGLQAYTDEMELHYFTATRSARQQAYQAVVTKLPHWLGRPVVNLLDVGCGDGLLLELARAAGIAGVGLEISPTLMQFVRSRLGEEVLVLSDIQALPDAAYDVVALLNVIEHLREPQVMLAHLQRILKPGGILLVHTPNLGGLPARLAKERWHQIEPFGHFYYFEQRTLKAMLEKNGFQPLARFNLVTSTGVKRRLHELLGALGIYLDNGLGVVSRRLD